LLCVFGLCQHRFMTLDMHQTESAARALLDSRIESVRALVTARQRVDELRAQIAGAEREDARLYSAALRAGWSADELKKLGLSEADRKARPRRRTTSPRQAAEQPSGDPSQTS
jgi:hypothetical protein